MLSDKDENVQYWFAYGKTKGYGSETTHRTVTIEGRDAHAVSRDIDGLSSGTRYHYTLCTEAPGRPPFCPGDAGFTTTGSVGELSIEANPKLYPDFDPAITDYVTRCGSSPVEVAVAAPAGTTVSVDGRSARGGSFTENVSLNPGQAFPLVTTTGTNTAIHQVRCLPPSFPGWTFSRQREPTAAYYVTTPQSGVKTPGGSAAADYVAIFDPHGVPIWWKSTPKPPDAPPTEPGGAFDAKPTTDGNLIWYTPTAASGQPGYEVRRPNGSLIRSWRTVGVETDIHDIQLLANGNALLVSYVNRPGTVDLSPYGGPSQGATVVDSVIQEVTPGGSVVWSWSTEDHLPPSQTGERWWTPNVMPVATLPDGRKAYDYAHLNSIQKIAGVVVASFRHFDAAYGIDVASKEILWKLGGTPHPKSLTVLDDQFGSYPLGGQHYARVLPDGTLTIYDNNSFLPRTPRILRYRLNLFDNTARLIEEFTEPEAPTSFCCGSTERLANGSYVTSWAHNPLITEIGPTGAEHFRLKFNGGLSYRVAPAIPGGPTVAALRAGMHAMAPR